MSGTAEKLMDLAELRMREAGYHGFSFRELASEIGITSASVHHHFPTKAEMVVAVMQRYKGKFAELVAPQPGETAEDAIASYRDAIRDGWLAQRGMCLSGVLGAEASGLPSELLGQVEIFFREAIDGLAARIGGPDAEERAFSILATLEGGLILARVYDDISAFDRATSGLLPANRREAGDEAAAHDFERKRVA